jgi:RNA polymerase sigma-70 factor (ECF subfamily)
MAVDDALPGRLTRWLTAAEPDWETVYADALPRVYNFFRYRFGASADAEDLTARTFEKAWRARNRYRRDLAGFNTWALSIARNVAIDHARRRRPDVALDEARAIPAAGTPESEAAARSDAERLARLLAGLPERDRELMALKYGAGLTNRAIAKATGLTESNVGTIVHRAVETIRRQW